MVGRAHRRCWSRRFLVAAGLLLPGCWGTGDDTPREPVAGSVTLDGQPVAVGTIRFFPTQQDSSGFAVEGGASIRNGRFSIARFEGLVPATYRVSIYSSGTASERSKTDIPGRAPKVSKELIPFKYNAKSELKADFPKGGLTDLKFDLHSK
jgi:hypothetical protein